MTKRILAIVMALVMSLSVLAVEVFATGTVFGSVNVTVNGNQLSISWQALTDATMYSVAVRNSTGATVSTQTVTTNSITVAVSGYGNFTVDVDAFDKDGTRIGAFSGSAYVEQSTTQNGLTVSGASASSTSVSWKAVTGVSLYYYAYTLANGTTQNGTTASTSFTIPAAYSDVRSVVVRIGDANGAVVGSWTNNGSAGGNTGTGTGTVSVNGYTLSWYSSRNETFFVSA